MTDDPGTIEEAGPVETAGGDVDALLDLLAAVADRASDHEALAGDDPGAQENRAIRHGQAWFARAEAERARADGSGVRGRARALARAAALARGQAALLGAAASSRVEDALAVLGASGRPDPVEPAATRAQDAQRVVEAACLVAHDVVWAQLAVDRGGPPTWSAGALPASAVAAIEAGPRAAVLAGAESVLAREGDERWASTLTSGVRSVMALAAGRGVLVLASTAPGTFGPAARLVAGHLAERGARATAGEEVPHDGDTALDLLDGARTALAGHLGIPHGATTGALVDLARAVDRPVPEVAAHVVLALLPGTPPPHGPTETREAEVPEPATLRRAVSYIDAHALDEVTIDDIARAAGVGPRGLQQLFRRHRSTTPTQYLREVRLDRAREELRDGSPSTGLTVGAVAARWHFGNPGRFSVAYRERFGSSPRHTLRA